MIYDRIKLLTSLRFGDHSGMYSPIVIGSWVPIDVDLHRYIYPNSLGQSAILSQLSSARGSESLARDPSTRQIAMFDFYLDRKIDKLTRGFKIEPTRKIILT